MSKKTYVDKKGYRRFNDSGKSVHRWVAEKKVKGKIGRTMAPTQFVFEFCGCLSL